MHLNSKFMDKATPTQESNINSCDCRQKLSTSTLTADLSVGTPGNTNADTLANALGLDLPLMRSNLIYCRSSKTLPRWANAAHVYHSSRAHSPIPSSGNVNFDFSDQIKSPLSIEDIAETNRNAHKEGGGLNENVGPLELEAISTLHELSPFVETINVSDILPKTSELIFLNLKTKDDLSFTLELTMKGWRICSTRNDCMNGNYLNFELHTRYFHNAKEVLRLLSPDHFDKFAANLTERLKALQAQEDENRKSLSPNFDSDLNSPNNDESVVSIPVPKSSSFHDIDIDDETMLNNSPNNRVPFDSDPTRLNM
ncbi:hypothetical protein M3Y97_00772000 [Aphelenchoides bicaudatus]|nr:hypothetical protein M3Y97_00772000 [Aphelenchoides bicaudatus]